MFFCFLLRLGSSFFYYFRIANLKRRLCLPICFWHDHFWALISLNILINVLFYSRMGEGERKNATFAEFDFAKRGHIHENLFSYKLNNMYLDTHQNTHQLSPKQCSSLCCGVFQSGPAEFLIFRSYAIERR